jgi:hypothetical protein
MGSLVVREPALRAKRPIVGKKQHNCDSDDPDDDPMGDYGDRVACDPEHRSVLAVNPGARSIEDAEAIVIEVERRLGGETPDVMNSDEYPAYETAIEGA